MKLQKMIYWLIPIVIILLVVTIPLLPIYNIKTVIVEGASEQLAADLAAASGVRQGENMFLTLLSKGNIFSMRFTKAEQELAREFVSLGEIRVRADLPSAVYIEYDVKQPVFEVENGDIYLVTDINGCVLDTRDVHQLGFTRITGLEIEGFAMGCIVGDALDRFKMASDIYKEMETFDKTELTAFREYIEWIDLSNPLYVAAMYDGRILVKLDADGDIAYLAATMCRVLSDDIGSGERGTLDISMDYYPVFSPD